ncbi:MAG: hypothetical protein ACK40O_12810 [Allosphingosinicella sp.]
MGSTNPVSAAKWLGLAYAGFVTVFLLWGAGAADVLLLTLASIPWITGPVALAAFGVKELEGTGGAWVFLILEAVLVASTAWLWIYLIMIAPDAQNGIAMLLFPAGQYGLVIALGLAAMALRPPP